MVNANLMLETLDHIEKNPQKWNQSVWFGYFTPNGDRVWRFDRMEVEERNSCGTAFCFAGHAAINAGFPKPPNDPLSPWQIIDPNGDRVRAEDFAREKLGLEVGQAGVLFDANNTMADLRKIVFAILANPDISGVELVRLTERFVVAGEEDDDRENEEDDDWCEPCGEYH